MEPPPILLSRRLRWAYSCKSRFFLSDSASQHGLMRMHRTPHPVDDEECFKSIKAGVDALPSGTKAFLNSGASHNLQHPYRSWSGKTIGEFYARDSGTGNLEMLSRFFAKYPDYAEKTFLSVKGGLRNMSPDGSYEKSSWAAHLHHWRLIGSLECLRESVDNIQRALGPIKKVDLNLLA